MLLLPGFFLAKRKISTKWNRNSFYSVICTGSDDASVRLFSSENGDFLGSNNLHNRSIIDLDFVPNSQKVGLNE